MVSIYMSNNLLLHQVHFYISLMFNDMELKQKSTLQQFILQSQMVNCFHIRKRRVLTFQKRSWQLFLNSLAEVSEPFKKANGKSSFLAQRAFIMKSLWFITSSRFFNFLRRKNHYLKYCKIVALLNLIGLRRVFCFRV